MSSLTYLSPGLGFLQKLKDIPDDMVSEIVRTSEADDMVSEIVRTSEAMVTTVCTIKICSAF